MSRTFEYDTTLHEVPERPGAYVVFPWDIREVFGRVRWPVPVTCDGEPYDGTSLNRGDKDEDGNVCYVIGVLKAIRVRLCIRDVDPVNVVVTEL